MQVRDVSSGSDFGGGSVGQIPLLDKVDEIVLAGTATNEMIIMLIRGL